jgi:hypothetical protein
MDNGYCFQVLLVFEFGPVEADDGAEEAEEAADVICIAHPGLLIGLNPSCRAHRYEDLGEAQDL